MADAVVNGFLTDGVKSVNFSADGSCVGGIPQGSIAGVIENIFTGGPVLSDFTFTSATPLLVGINVPLGMVHIVFINVTVTNVTTGQIFTGGTAEFTTTSITPEAWDGSITIHFNSHILTFFGRFIGSSIEEVTEICQELL